MNCLPGYFIVNESGSFAEIILKDGGYYNSLIWHQRAWEGATRFVQYSDAKYWIDIMRHTNPGIGVSVVNFDINDSYLAHYPDVHTREISFSDLAAKLNMDIDKLQYGLDSVIDVPVYPYLQQVCQLHERIDLLYVVDGYIATFSNRDGNNEICEAKGNTIHVALTRLNEAVKDFQNGTDY